MVNEKPILIVAAGDARIANPKYKAKFGTKAAMLSFEDAEKLIGHAVGGVCPFAVNGGSPYILTNPLKDSKRFFPPVEAATAPLNFQFRNLKNIPVFRNGSTFAKIGNRKDIKKTVC